MSNGQKDNAGKVLLVGATAGGVAALINRLLAAKPAEAAPPEEQWNYLIACQEAIIGLLRELVAAQGPGVPGVEVSVLTPWVAKEPEELYEEAIRSIGTFETEGMVDFRNAKRIIFKIESSLDQPVNIQPVGAIFDSFTLATNINGVFPCVANGSIHIGLAWDDWMPFVGLRITTAVAPTTGILKVWAVVQE